ncbi:hypothetical protein J2X36_005489, partial [Methylobacterium sp. BE186]|nr:hypothetical protein [Methylobacterium sp. BE186]
MLAQAIERFSMGATPMSDAHGRNGRP